MEDPKIGSRTALIQWSESFSVGIKELDIQHQRWINLINRLSQVSATNSIHSEIISSILEEMTAYAQVHFKAEEKLMEAYDFPLKNIHKSSHLNFRVKIIDFYEGKDQSAEQTAEEISNYLGNWLIHHILEEDMAYKDFFVDKGLR